MKDIIKMQTASINANVSIAQINRQENLDELEYDWKKYETRHSQNDFVSRPGQPDVAFSPQDTIIGVKDPSALLGGGDTINIEVNTTSSDPNAIANEIVSQLSARQTRRSLRASGA